MSYAKLLKTAQDHAIGMQSVDQALANNRAMYFDEFDPGHSVGQVSFGSPDPFLGPGRHDDVLIARTVADFTIDDTHAAPIAYALISGPIIFGTPIWMKEGQWKIFITTGRLFFAQAIIKGASSGNPRQAMCHISMDLSGPFVTVSTWNVAGGVLEAADFSLVLWAEGVV